MSNAVAVEQEMLKYGQMKWQILVESGGSQVGNLVVEAIKEKVPVDTGSAKSGITHDLIEVGPWAFKIGTYAKDIVNSRSGESILEYIPCLELGGPCTHNQNRPPHFFFRNGSLESKDKMDALLAEFW